MQKSAIALKLPNASLEWGMKSQLLMHNIGTSTENILETVGSPKWQLEQVTDNEASGSCEFDKLRVCSLTNQPQRKAQNNWAQRLVSNYI